MTDQLQTTASRADDRTVLHVEIGPLDGANQRSVLVNPRLANGRTARREVSATTLDALSRLLSERNIALLNIIREQRPASVAELARLSGRPKASLTLTLRRLEKFGIIAFKNCDGRRRVPTVVCDRLRLEVSLYEAPCKANTRD